MLCYASARWRRTKGKGKTGKEIQLQVKAFLIYCRNIRNDEAKNIGSLSTRVQILGAHFTVVQLPADLAKEIVFSILQVRLVCEGANNNKPLLRWVGRSGDGRPHPSRSRRVH